MVPFESQILKKVKNTLETHNLIQSGDKIIVAVSGGADSICLLHILNSLKNEFNLSLHIAHLNHLLRGKESERDADFVKKTAKSLSLAFTIEKADIKFLKRKLKTSTQAAARRARIDFLLRLKKKLNATKIALGHTLDDRAETVLLNLIRGSGTSGMAGMEFFNHQLSIIRPLMEITRKEVEVYLDKIKTEYITDSSNLKKIYLRNRIRLELIPLLEKNFNPQIKKRIADTAQILSMDDEYLETLAEESLKFINTKNPDKPKTESLNTTERIVLDINLLKILPPPVVHRIIRKILWRLSKNNKNISFVHTSKTFSLIKEGRTGVFLNLPDKIKVQKLYNGIVFFRADKSKEKALKEVELIIPGKTKLIHQNRIINSVIASKNSIKFLAKDENLGIFDFDKIKLPLIIRYKKEGDRFTPLGMDNPKKLKKFFIDLKIPQYKRKEIALLVSGNEIVWVVGKRISENFKVTTSTRKVLLTGFTEESCK